MRFFDKIGEENYNDNALRRPAHAYTDNLGTVMENFKAHGSYTIDEDLSISEPLKLNQPINDQLDLIYKLTSNENYNNRLLSTQKIGAKGRGVYDANKDFYKSAETSQLILELQKKYPDAGLKSYEEMMAEVEKDLAEKRQHLATLSARSQGGSRALGTITGMGAYMLDPAIVATIPFSGGWSTGRGIFGNMKRSFVIEAGLAGMAETAITPYVYEWKQEIGSPFELKDAVIRIMTASIGAGVIRSGASVTIDLAQLTKATIMLRKQGKTVEADVLDTYADLVKDAPTVREIVEPVKPKLSTKEALKIEKEAKKAWQAKKDELQQKAYDDGRRMNTDDEFDEIELLRLEWLKKEVDYFLIKLTKQTDKNEIAKLEKHIQDLVNNINKRAERNLVNAKFEPYKLKQPSKGETLSAQDKHIIAQSKVEEDLVAGRVLDQDELDALNYRGSHTSPEPDAEYKTSLDDFSDIFPDKATSPNFKKYYGMGGEYAKADIETIKVMKAAMGKPDAEITIYRAVPKGTKDINAGDWVSTSKDYATKHGELYIDEGFEIISKKVKAKEIHSAGDLHEWGYHPAKKLEPVKVSDDDLRSVWKEAQDGASIKQQVEALIKEKPGIQTLKVIPPDMPGYSIGSYVNDKGKEIMVVNIDRSKIDVNCPGFCYPEMKPRGKIPKSLIKDTREKYTFKNGKYKKNRAAVHKKYIDEQLANGTTAKAGEKPIVWIMGGGTASGKGTVLKKAQAEDVIPEKGFVHADPDVAKKILDEFNKLSDLGDHRAASVVHRESSDITNELIKQAIKGKKNIIVDKTLGDVEKGLNTIKKFKDAGYDVRLVGVTIDPSEALVRALTRYFGSGRLVMSGPALTRHKGFNAGFEKYAKEVDEAMLYDNTGLEAIPIARVKNGETEIFSNEGYNQLQIRGKLNEKTTTHQELRESQGLPAKLDRPTKQGNISGAGRVAESSDGTSSRGNDRSEQKPQNLNDQLKDTGLDLDDPYLNELSIKEQQLVDDLLADGDIDIPSGVRIDADGKEVVEFRSAKEALEELDAEHKAVDDMFRCMKGAA